MCVPGIDIVLPEQPLEILNSGDQRLNLLSRQGLPIILSSFPVTLVLIVSNFLLQ
jgi:hypothetical protein